MTVPTTEHAAVADAGGTLRRELGLGGAVFMGLGSMLGTGVFVSIALAAGLAGPSVVLALVIAALVATCNALSSAQLAAAYPVSGGTYEYGYRLLTPGLGFASGWLFLCAKSASAATAALGCAAYLLQLLGMGDATLRSILAVILILVLAALVLSGIRRSNLVNIIIVSITLFALGAFVVAGIGPLIQSRGDTMTPFFGGPRSGHPLHGLLEASAIMFVAYTGYGRIATMGEEVRDPQRIIPLAIIITLVVTAALYAAVGIVAVGGVGADQLAASVDGGGAVLESVARAFGAPLVGKIVAIGAITAMLGVLLNLILGLSRVVLAMGRRGDLPKAVGKILIKNNTPALAIIVVVCAIAGIASFGSIALAWSLSALTVLVYYAITNAAALRLPAEQRLYPRWIAWAGLVSCIGLVFFIEPRIWLVGAGILLAGFVLRGILHRRGGTRLQRKP